MPELLALLMYRSVLCTSRSFLFLVEHYCSDPDEIENGQMEGSGPFNCISTVKYSCNEGYWLLGAETLRCGIDGLWKQAKPSCIDMSKKQRKKSK